MKKISLLFRLLLCLLFFTEIPSVQASFFDGIKTRCTNLKSRFDTVNTADNREYYGKRGGLGLVILGVASTIPLYIASKKKIDTYSKMLNIHNRFIEVFPYFESWKKNKRKNDLIKLIGETDPEILIFEHQQARQLYNALIIATKKYNDNLFMVKYIIKQKVSLEKLTDLDAALDFLRIFIKQSEGIVTTELIEKIKQDPYFSIKNKSVPIKAIVLFPTKNNENQALSAFNKKIKSMASTLTTYKEFLLCKKNTPQRELALQTIHDLLYTIKIDLEYDHNQLPSAPTKLSNIHASINPSAQPQAIPNIQPQQAIPIAIEEVKPSFFKRLLNPLTSLFTKKNTPNDQEKTIIEADETADATTEGNPEEPSKLKYYLKRGLAAGGIVATMGALAIMIQIRKNRMHDI